MPICRQFIDTLYRGKSFTTKIMRSHLWLSATSNSHTNQMITVFILTIARAACLDGQGRTSSLEGVDGAHPTIQSDSLSRSSSDHASLLEDKVQYQSGNRYFHSDPRCIEDLLYLGLEEIASVNTKYGKLTGRISYLCDFPGSIEAPLGRRPRVMANVTLFLGVPYAKAPTKENNLRFKSPRPPDFWGSIDAAQYKASCPQPIEFTGPHRMIDRVSEDCLYINIFSPTVSPFETSSLTNVFVSLSMFACFSLFLFILSSFILSCFFGKYLPLVSIFAQIVPQLLIKATFLPPLINFHAFTLYWFKDLL